MAASDGTILGSPPPDYGKWIERDYINEQRNQALAGRVRANQAKQNDALVNKYIHDIDVGDKVHRWDEDAVRNNYASALAAIEQTKEKYGEYNYKNYIPQVIAPYVENAKMYVQHKQTLDKAYADADAMEKMSGATPETIALKNALQKGKPEDVHQDAYGNVESAKDEHGLTNINVNMYPKYDWGKELDGELSKQKLNLQTLGLQNPNLQAGEKPYAVLGANFRTQDEADAFAKKTGFPAVSNERIIKNLVSSPTHFRSAEQEVRDQLEKDYPDYDKLSHADRVDAVSKEMFAKYGDYGAVKYDYKVDKPPASQRSSSFGNTYTKGDFQWELNESPNGVQTFNVHPTKGGDVKPQKWQDLDGNFFDGTVQQLVRVKGETEPTAIVVTRKYQPNDKGIVRVDRYTGKQLNESATTVAALDKDGKPIEGKTVPINSDPNRIYITTTTTKDDVDVPVRVPANDHNLSNTHLGGVTLDDIEKNIKSKGGKSGMTTVGGGKKKTTTTSQSTSEGAFDKGLPKKKSSFDYSNIK